MNNPHSLARAINFDRLNSRFASALQKAWSAATCWDGCRAGYPADNSNPSFDNCFVSTLAAWADGEFEGEIVPCLSYTPDGAPPAWHFQLYQNGETINPTAQQFPPGTIVEQLTPAHPEYRKALEVSLFDPHEERRLRERMTLLLGTIIVEGGYEMQPSADFIVDQAQAWARSKLPMVMELVPTP